MPSPPSPAPFSASPMRSLWLAVALSMGAAISLGITRFAYALLLPPMREDLGWSYTLAGGMNTANALRYLLGALATPWLLRRAAIKAVLLVGAVGLVVSVCFIALSAPDLALTQLSVDVVTTVLLLMGLSLLPQLSPYESSRTRHWRDVVIALLGGAGIAWLAWLIMTRDHQSISWFFMQEALPKGGGSNVVNVILVDFRGFDTFGEICVLAIAAIGALVMMDGMRAHGAIATPGLTLRFNPSPLMLRMTASWVLPIALVYSLYILLRGHNLPGGGFIAGLITAIALVIQYIAIGQEQAEKLIHARDGRLYECWIGGGLTLAGLTGMGALFWNKPFLTSAYFYIDVPILGKLPIASAMLFDIGVFFTVVGATLLLISVLGDSRHSSMSGPVLPEKQQ